MAPSSRMPPHIAGSERMMDKDVKPIPGGEPWRASPETVRYDRARVALLHPIKDAVDHLGLPLIRVRKIKGIINALEMQIEDGGDSPEVNRCLLDALRAALRHQKGEQQTRAAIAAIAAFERKEDERWNQIRAGSTPVLDLSPSERLDDLMQEGYKLLDKKQTVAACDRWLQAWELVKQLARPEMKTATAFDKVCGQKLSQIVFNWRSDLAMELGNAGHRNPVYLEHLLRYAREYFGLFPEENTLTQLNFRRNEAEALWDLGRKTEAEAIYAALLEQFPDEGWGYIGWADSYWLDDDSPKDYARAEAIL
ncbi:MAG: hypothetical protein JNM56_00285 [Planctomycetia bacterium]|nr:hypothetical protein [Planctomycetia bacterium]